MNVLGKLKNTLNETELKTYSCSILAFASGDATVGTLFAYIL